MIQELKCSLWLKQILQCKGISLVLECNGWNTYFCNNPKWGTYFGLKVIHIIYVTSVYNLDHRSTFLKLVLLRSINVNPFQTIPLQLRRCAVCDDIGDEADFPLYFYFHNKMGSWFKTSAQNQIKILEESQANIRITFCDLGYYECT